MKVSKITIALSITMFNEIKFVDLQLNNALEMDCYDYICILDDGSTDGTWDKINEYASKFKHVHVFRTPKNSITGKQPNRWIAASKNVAQFNPTWVNNRAADIIYCDAAKRHLRPQIEAMTARPNIGVIKLPTVHLWRSKTWYRADNVWGDQARNQSTPSIWRFNKNFKWGPRHKSAVLHQGFTRPSNLGFGRPMLSTGINQGLSKRFPWTIVGLHYGHIDHEAKVKKFDFSMRAAKAGKALGMPRPEQMPPIGSWLRYNGYKGFVEWNMNLQKVHSGWYDTEVVYEPRPVPTSLYDTIKKWNPKRAEEYKRVFNERVNK